MSSTDTNINSTDLICQVFLISKEMYIMQWIYMWTSCFLGQATGMLQLYKLLTSSRSYSRFAFSIIVTPLYKHRKT